MVQGTTGNPLIYLPGLRRLCAQDWPQLPLEGSHCWNSHKTEGCEFCFPWHLLVPARASAHHRSTTRHSSGLLPPALGRLSLHRTNTKCNRYNQPDAVTFHHTRRMEHSGLNSAKGIPPCCLPCSLGVPSLVSPSAVTGGGQGLSHRLLFQTQRDDVMHKGGVELMEGIIAHWYFWQLSKCSTWRPTHTTSRQACSGCPSSLIGIQK